MTITLLIYLLRLSVPAPDTSFVLIPAGDYWVGQKGHQVNPLRKVRVNSYYIAVTEVTNRQFEAFIHATGYRTDAERLHNAMVFEPGLKEFRWLEDSTAHWRYPNGISRGGITDKMDHPVTTISYADIQAYCKWAKVRLPSFEEWEIASRAGARSRYFWGDDDSNIGQYANVWHGHDHLVADSSDGYMYTAPVGSFKPNGFGLYDVYGNVFEFCEGHLGNELAVHARGGSWWCSQHSCSYFNSVEIGRVHPHASFSNQGFRVAKSH
jgi:sulfatase modifying factor 1